MMALATVDILIMLPLLIVMHALSSSTYKYSFRPYKSWSSVHSHFGTVLEVPADVFDGPGGSTAFAITTISRWTAPIGAILFFM